MIGCHGFRDVERRWRTGHFPEPKGQVDHQFSSTLQKDSQARAPAYLDHQPIITQRTVRQTNTEQLRRVDAARQGLVSDNAFEMMHCQIFVPLPFGMPEYR